MPRCVIYVDNVSLMTMKGGGSFLNFDLLFGGSIYSFGTLGYELLSIN